MGTAESISDLRSLLSIVAEETGALKMNDADEDSVGWTTEGPLPMTFGHVRRAHAALAALETALSAAKPVAWVDEQELRYLEMVSGNKAWADFQRSIKVGGEKEGRLPLYAAPTAPSVAVKALEWNPFRADTPFGNYHIDDQTDRSPEELNGRPPFLLSGSRLDLTRHSTLEAAKAAAQADYEARIRSALTAQVQDVAGWLPADEAPRGTVALISHRSGQIDYVYKTNNGEPFLETWRYAGTASHGQQAPWPEYYLPISALPAGSAKQEG